MTGDLALRGVSLYGPPPLGAIHLPWSPGLNVLYGLNGAGKTTVLQHLEAALTGYAFGGGSSLLHFSYREEHDQHEAYGRDDYARFKRPRASEGVRNALLDRWPNQLLGDLGDPPETLTEIAAGLWEAQYWDMVIPELTRLVQEHPHFCLEAVGTDTPEWVVHIAVDLPHDEPLRTEVLTVHQHWLHYDPAHGSFEPIFRDPAIPPLDIEALSSKYEAEDEEGAWEEEEPDYYDPNDVRFESLAGPIESGLDNVPWALIPIVHTESTSKAITGPVLTEALASRDLLAETVRALRTDCRTYGPTVDATSLWGPTETNPGPLTSEAEAALQRYGERATEIFKAMLPEAPALRCVAAPLSLWLDGRPVAWQASTGRGEPFSIERLSLAQGRWARLAVAIALTEQSGGFHTVLIDEPEASLHPLAVRSAAKALAEGVFGPAPVIVASHSPTLITAADTAFHVYRDHTAGARAEALVDPTATPALLGLSAADALSLVRAFVLVEGPHDEIVLSHFLRERLRAADAFVLPVGGAAASKELEARFLAQFSDARLVVLVDKARAETYRQALGDLRCQSSLDPAALDEVWSSYFPKPTTEEVFVRKFCVRAHELGVLDRVHVDGVPADDVLDYLPVQAFVDGAESWTELRDEHQKVGSKQNFKNWLQKAKRADLTLDHIRQVTSSVESIPNELADLGGRLDAVLSR